MEMITPQLGKTSAQVEGKIKGGTKEGLLRR